MSEAYRSIFRLSGSIMIYEIFRKISVNLCYNKIMKKKKFIVLSVAIIAIALLLEAGIFRYFNDKNAYRTSTVLVDRVLTVLNKNDESKNDLIESLKEDYKVRAKAVSYIIDAKPQVEYDIEELQQIAQLMMIDEIHLLDENGAIYSGSIPKYFGYNFDSGEQMSYFKPMLKDKNLTMCQDVTPNTSEGKDMMYAITWNEDKTKMIQVGITPKRLLDEIKQNTTSNVVAQMPVYKGIEIFAANTDTKVIEGATDNNKIGTKLDTIGISTKHITKDKLLVKRVKIDGKHCRCMIKKSEELIIAVTVEDAFYMQGSLFATLIVGIYLVLASCCMIYMLSKLIKERFEKEKLLYTSNTDELTKCFNRRAYEADIAKLDLNKTWIYLSIDLNELKRANDSYGHAAGDELICAAADCMKHNFQDYGSVYRIGGDEFVVLITKQTECFEKMLKTFDDSIANWHGKLVDSLTVSYGYVFSSEKSWDSVYEIPKVADQKMYQSKERFYRESGLDRRR